MTAASDMRPSARLVLRREALTTLAGDDLAGVAGGATIPWCAFGPTQFCPTYSCPTAWCTGTWLCTDVCA